MQLKNLKTKYKFVYISLFALAIFAGSFSAFNTSSAATVEELNQKIEQQRKRIAEIEKEIEEQRNNVNRTAKDAQTLSAAISELESAKKSLEKSITKTQSEIEETELNIEKLNLEINTKEESIDLNKEVLARSIREMEQMDSQSILESFLTESVNEVWTFTYSVQKIQEALRRSVRDLLGLKTELSEKQTEEEKAKQELESEHKLLAGEKSVVQKTQKEKDDLLKVTKNKEANYKALLAQKENEKKQFEQDLFDFESQLKIAIDPNLYQSAESGVFGWPVANVRVTQLFGKTAFAQSFKGYAQPFHNGIDFGVPLGTQVKAVLGGVVKGSGNTDLYPGCNSWGGWVLIEHPNGLTTLYAHLSQSFVTAGEQVAKGQAIALSGSTGVSTGPHLHLTVYASQGVKVRTFKEMFPGKTSGCALSNGSIPSASLDAYLDPSDYLPK